MAENRVSLHDRLIRMLIEMKLVTEDAVAKVLEEQKEKGGKLTDLLVSMGLVSKKDISVALCREYGCPAIDLGRFKIIPEVIGLIPKKIAKQYSIVPVSKIGSILTVAMTDPLDILAIDDLKAASGCEICPVLAQEKDIANAIAEHYDGVTHDSIEAMVDDIGKHDADINVIEDAKGGEFNNAELLRLTQDAPVVKITNLILSDSVRLRSSDCLIEPLEDQVRVRYRVDGMLVEGKKLPFKMQFPIVSRLKVMADLNIAERRLPQDGRFKLKIQNHEVDFRISILPTSKGEKVALRVLDKSQAMLSLDTLGFEQKPLADLKAMSEHPHGMILVCGPTGCGKTTTLYSVLKYIDTPDVNIVTVEDPVEYQLPGINQVTARPDIGLSFASALRSILRQDPDIIMVGEIRDFETVDIAIKAALTGHLVLSTLHTTTASGSMVRLMNMGVEPFLIASSILMVAAQRLVRRVCPNCKEPHQVDPAVIERIGLKKGAVVYRGKGCKACQNTGYRGRVGLIETLVLTPAVRDLILDRRDEHIITETARKEGMETLRMSAIKKVIEGTTSIEEVLRVTDGEQDVPVR
ncbi:MAG: ATPase, T2SS/T4P/T4SS family [Candidatus Omnitrophica bacterium]|nr:ATPase, T2SS/T4P/T4SS family [Candidatus Omnitrophota bacterium]